MNTNAFRKLSYGVYIVSAWDNGRATGCTANSAMQITSTPATIAVSINHNNYTNKCIQDSGRFAVSILSEQSDPSIIGTFGFQSGETVNKFDSVAYELKGYMPVVKDSCAYIVCEVIDKMETETHTVFLGKVVDADVLSDQDPMTYAYYHNVVRARVPRMRLPTFRKLKRARPLKNGCAESAAMFMKAILLLKSCRRIIPVRYANSRKKYLLRNKVRTCVCVLIPAGIESPAGICYTVKSGGQGLGKDG